jgi:hypothetical protein
MGTAFRLFVAMVVALSLLVANERAAAGSVQAQDVTLVTTISTSTKALDLGVANSGTPSAWDTAAYDDAAWNRAVPIGSETVGCIHASLGDLGKLPFFWGPKPDHYYAFRVTIAVPAAQSYNGSSIDYANNDSTNSVSLNGSVLANLSYHPSWYNGLHAIPIKALVTPGLNVLGIVEGPSTHDCKGIVGARITIHAHGVKGPVQSPSAAPMSDPAVSLAFPADSAIVAGNSLPLSWDPMPNAAAYLVHLWLVKANVGQPLTARTAATISRTVTSNHTSIATTGMLKGLYRWNIAAVGAKGVLIADWGVSRTVQLAAG